MLFRSVTHGAVCSGLFGSNSTEVESVISYVESTMASRSGETEAGEGVVTERTRENLELEREKLSDVEVANLYTRQQNEREDQHKKSVYNICDSRERDGKSCNSYN